MSDGNDIQDILESADTSLLKYQQTVEKTQDKRYKALSQIEPLLETATSIDENEKPSVIEAKMNIVNTYATILDKIDNASHRNAITSMKKKDSDAQGDEGKQVIEFIRQLAGKPDPFQDKTLNNVSEASDHVDQRAQDEGVNIEDTELRSSPDDLSHT